MSVLITEAAGLALGLPMMASGRISPPWHWAGRCHFTFADMPLALRQHVLNVN